ncbi:hypothetical protein EOM39_05850 [Candidatus Gracilibacteria bacterium]|nr:hypothetical protein [Candidatus Gracilibacteria bacterium]
MNISIFASIGCQNLGDELILKNEIKLFENEALGTINQKTNKKFSFRVFTYDIKNIFYLKENIKYLEYFPIGIREKRNILRNFKNLLNLFKTVIWSDIIVIGGGGIIYDNEVQSNKHPLDQWVFRNKLFRFFRKKVIFYAIGLNIKNEENYKKVEKIFKNATKVFVRDMYSFKLLQSLGIKSEIIEDPVFCDKDINYKMDEGKSSLVKEIESNNFSLKDLDNVSLENKNIGITFRAGYVGKSGNEKIEIFLIRELVEFLLSKNCKVFFLPHSIHLTDIKSNDLEFYNKIISKSSFENDVFVAKNLEEVYNYYTEKKLDLCLAMRLHSMILSQVYEIPFVAFSYSKKTEELVKRIRSKTPMKATKN